MDMAVEGAWGKPWYLNYTVMSSGMNLGQNAGKYRKENYHKTRAKCFIALVTFIFKVNFKNGWNCG